MFTAPRLSARRLPARMITRTCPAGSSWTPSRPTLTGRRFTARPTRKPVTCGTLSVSAKSFCFWVWRHDNMRANTRALHDWVKTSTKNQRAPRLEYCNNSSSFVSILTIYSKKGGNRVTWSWSTDVFDSRASTGSHYFVIAVNAHALACLTRSHGQEAVFRSCCSLRQYIIPKL